MTESKINQNENGKNAPESFRIGCLNVSSYSHLEGLWAPLINPRQGQKDMPFTGMRITIVGKSIGKNPKIFVFY